MYNDEKTEKHPSYVMVGFSRRQGNPGRLFGSALPHHQTYITLSVTTATQVTRNGDAMYFGGRSTFMKLIGSGIFNWGGHSLSG